MAPLPNWLRWFGVASGALCSLLMYWTLSSLGRNLTDTVVTRAEATLVTHGPYRWVRHPFYVTAALLMASVTLLTASWLIGLCSLIILALQMILQATKPLTQAAGVKVIFGTLTRDDLRAYEARWSDPVEANYVGLRVLTRGGLSNVVATLEALPSLRGLSPADRALTLAAVLVARPYTGHGEQIGDTTNLVTADADGNACVLTTSLGLGSGDFLPGLDIHLNSMVGEVDLQVQPLVAGARMESMMSPTLVLDGGQLVLAAGAAGGTRLRPALVQVLSSILDEGWELQDAVDRPRLHSTGELVHLEPGFPDEAAAALESEYDVKRWTDVHHYFGGVSLIGESGGAADPRRSGTARSLS